MILEYHPLAAFDLNEAIEFYNNRRNGLGDELRAEVYSAIERIVKNPYQYSSVKYEIRRHLIHRFPYSILYRVTKSEHIRILVIRHHRRHPKFGLTRR
ncbi:MAG: type II toxin-antitoxin system RelE/ParE family toxin [Balneolaceae bacterium]